MDQTKIYGTHGKGQSLCLSCAKRIYGNSLEMYLNTGDIQVLNDNNRPAYTSNELLCDECINRIFLPGKAEDFWWQVVPDQAEHIRLLLPFADFLETLRVDVMNLRSFTVE
jgi:hypothetical protein